LHWVFEEHKADIVADKVRKDMGKSIGNVASGDNNTCINGNLSVK
jgi:hypothetical protein